MSRITTALLILGLTAPLYAQSRSLDAHWTSYFGADSLVYAEVKNPAIDGPLMHRPLDADAAQGAGPGQFVRILLEDAKKEKIVESNFAELTPDGFAVGMAPGADAKTPAGLLVVAKNPKLERFYGWVVDHYQKRNGVDSVTPVTIEGAKGSKFLKNPRGPAVMVMTDAALLISNQEDAIAGALKRAKDGKDSVANAKFFKRTRSRVGADAAMFALVDPLALVGWMERAGDADQAKKMADAKKNFEAIDALSFVVSAEKAASKVELSVLLDTASPAYKAFRALAGQSGVKSAQFVSADTPALVAIIRPGDPTKGVSPELRESLTSQFTQAKGFMQTQTGLDFDVDIAPWWGNEIALALSVPEQGSPEGALLFETKDAKAAQVAVDKAAKHIGISQNRTFVERKVGDFTLKIAEPPPGGGPSPVNPTLGVAGGYVVLATGADVITDAIESKDKLAGTPAFKRLAGTAPEARTGVVLYLKSDVLLKAQKGQPAGPNSPALKIKKFAEDVDSIAVSGGWPDDESVRLTILFNGR